MALNAPRRGGWRDGFLPAFPHVGAEWRLSAVAWIALFVAIAVAGGAALGWLIVQIGPLKPAAALLGAAGLILVLSDARAGLWATIGVITLLPFAVIPVRVGLTLTLFEAAALATLAVWLLALLLRRDRVLTADTTMMLIVLFVTVTFFAFLLGVGRGYTMATYHDYGKFLLGVLLVFAVWNLTATLADARRVAAVLLAAGGAASLLGLALYAGGPGLTLRVLARLIPYGYPASRIVRYIEDDPAKSMRLVSTSVDPNSFGGLLAVVFVLAAAQAIARHRVLSRWLTVPVAGLSGAAVLLTFSRGAWVGIAAGIAVLILLRYRWLIVPSGALALLVIGAGLGSSFIHRLWLGLTLQDPATKLRLAEYRNALAIIRTHPLFGVGFGGAPSIEQQTGVSSIYLAIAERTGLVGLALFLIAVGAIALVGFRAWRARPDCSEGDLLLGLLAAFASALVIGVFDHYYFNITFPHMVALFWIVAGLILALSALAPGSTGIRRR